MGPILVRSRFEAWTLLNVVMTCGVGRNVTRAGGKGGKLKKALNWAQENLVVYDVNLYI